MLEEKKSLEEEKKNDLERSSLLMILKGNGDDKIGDQEPQVPMKELTSKVKNNKFKIKYFFFTSTYTNFLLLIQNLLILFFYD